MANTAKLLTGNRRLFYNGNPVHIYHVIIDTVDTDLTVRAIAATNMGLIIGWTHSEGDATNLKIKLEESSPDDYHTLQLAASQGIFQSMGVGPAHVTSEGQDIIIQSSVAIASILLAVVETDVLELGR